MPTSQSAHVRACELFLLAVAELRVCSEGASFANSTETSRPQCLSWSQPTPSALGRQNSYNRCAGMAVTPSVLCNTSSRIRSEEQRVNGEWCLNMNELIPSVDVLGTDADTCKGGFQFQYRSRRWGRLTVIVLEPGGCCICILPFLI